MKISPLSSFTLIFPFCAYKALPEFAFNTYIGAYASGAAAVAVEPNSTSIW